MRAFAAQLSRTDGHTFAFGNTLEHLITENLGHAARGSGRPLNRLTGEGRVEEKHGAYADALAKGHAVFLLVVEACSGAMSPGLTHLLHDLHQLTKLPGGIDSTIYGASRRATRSFRVHHAAAIAHAAVLADASVLARAASRVSVALAHAPA